MKILFVCMGNICRSATAEGIAQKMIHEQGLQERFSVDSAGTLSAHQGEGADPRMKYFAGLKGYELTSISRPVTYNDFETNDLIVAMDEYNVEDLQERAPSLEATQKIVRMADYLSIHPELKHIPDPYYGGDQGFILVVELLENAIANLLKQLTAGSKGAAMVGR